jgi:hypothetical protein
VLELFPNGSNEDRAHCTSAESDGRGLMEPESLTYRLSVLSYLSAVSFQFSELLNVAVSSLSVLIT